MHWLGLRGGTAALAGLLALLLAMPRSFAETSSWIGRAEKLEPSAPKAKDHKPAAPIKIIKTVPGPPKGMPAPTTRSASQSTYAKPAQPPAPGPCRKTSCAMFSSFKFPGAGYLLLSNALKGRSRASSDCRDSPEHPLVRKRRRT